MCSGKMHFHSKRLTLLFCFLWLQSLLFVQRFTMVTIGRNGHMMARTQTHQPRWTQTAYKFQMRCISFGWKQMAGKKIKPRERKPFHNASCFQQIFFLVTFLNIRFFVCLWMLEEMQSQGLIEGIGFILLSCTFSLFLYFESVGSQFFYELHKWDDRSAPKDFLLLLLLSPFSFFLKSFVEKSDHNAILISVKDKLTAGPYVDELRDTSGIFLS